MFWTPFRAIRAMTFPAACSTLPIPPVHRSLFATFKVESVWAKVLGSIHFWPCPTFLCTSTVLRNKRFGTKSKCSKPIQSLHFCTLSLNIAIQAVALRDFLLNPYIPIRMDIPYFKPRTIPVFFFVLPTLVFLLFCNRGPLLSFNP